MIKSFAKKLIFFIWKNNTSPILLLPFTFHQNGIARIVSVTTCTFTMIRSTFLERIRDGICVEIFRRFHEAIVSV